MEKIIDEILNTKTKEEMIEIFEELIELIENMEQEEKEMS